MSGAPRRRAGLPLTWRVAVLAGAATALLAGLTLVVSYVIVRNGMYDDLRRSLRQDAATLAAVYATGEGSAGTSLTGPTGGVVLQVYGPGAQLLAASRTEWEAPQAAIPPDVIVAAGLVPAGWSGTLLGQPVEVALAPFAVGVVAVIADPSYIEQTLASLSRTLIVVAAALVVLSLLVGYLVAAASLRPVTRLARRVSRLEPDAIEPLEYDGPRDEVARLTETVNALLGRLRAARLAQRVFLAETSHELRTPLTSLRGFLDRAARKAGPAAAEDLDDARRVTGTMARLVEDLLQLSRGEIVREPNPHLVELSLDVLRPVAAEFAGVAVEDEVPALVVGDPVRLRQLVRNLVANAVRAATASEGVRLRLTTDASEGNAYLEVEDDGPGIPPDQQERIFEKFYKGAGGGSGLGLAIAQQVAKHHDGTLTVASEPGRTVFTICLPLAQEDDED
ncbi:MAG TPA: HAMP domain-containing sensor histidine kinase [Trueperaceae bacterium]|nr:HAMP domain-containing sensor histidine kinase [Trueperaceae bacterium]